MLFFLHIALLLHGLLAILVAKLRTTQVAGIFVAEYLPADTLEWLEKLFPPQVYKVWQEGTSEQIAEPGQAYAIGAGQMAWAVYYLNSKHRA